MPNTLTAAPIENDITQKVVDRFWRNVLIVPYDRGCWIWHGAIMKKGYGVLNVSRQARLAHRISYILHRGPIGSKSCVLHRCDNPSCVNPDHLFLGSRADNNLDMRLKQRHSKGEKHSLICRGERHSRLKLTEEKVKIIRQMCDSGLFRQREIARMFGIKQETVSGIVHRRIWRFVE